MTTDVEIQKALEERRRLRERLAEGLEELQETPPPNSCVRESAKWRLSDQ